MQKPTTALTHRTINGASWVGISQIFNRVIVLATNVLLAQLLLPEEIGLYNVARSILAIFFVITDLGMNAAIIQKKEIEQDDYSTAFWLNFLSSLGAMAVLFISAPLLANFYRQEILSSILYIGGLTILLSGFSSIQRAHLTRTMNFRKISLVDIISTFVLGMISIFFAFRGMGYFALVYGLVASRLISTVILWFYEPLKIRFCVNKKSVLSLFSFGMWVLLTQLVGQFSNNVDILIIGRILPKEEVGIYSYAFWIGTLIPTQINDVLTSVLFPAFSEIQDDLGKIRHVYLQTTSILANIFFPMMFGLIIVADLVVMTFLGNKWVDVIPILRLLSILGLFNGIGGPLWGAVIKATGKPRLIFIMTLIRLVSISIFVLVGSFWGLIGVGMSLALYGFIFRFVYQALVNRFMHLEMKDYLRSFLSGLFPSLIMVSVLLISRFFLRGIFSNIFLLLIQVFLGIGVHVAGMYLFERKQFDVFVGIIRTLRSPNLKTEI